MSFPGPNLSDEQERETLFKAGEIIMRLAEKQANAMEYAPPGNTGLLVSKFCFGTMAFGDVRGLFKGISRWPGRG